MDTFIYILFGISALLIVLGISILSNKSLEIGALGGCFPLVGGLILGAIAVTLWCIQHLSFKIV